MKLDGIGLGLRVAMADEFLERLPEEVRFLEVHPENYIQRGGQYDDNLRRAREHYPIISHGLTLGFGTVMPYDDSFLAATAAFVQELGTPWHSDHLCFGGFDGRLVHDLLPVPFTEEAAAQAAANFVKVRDTVDRELAFENLSYYAPQSDDPLDEARFCVEVLERTDGKILLDVNNVYVNSKNLGFDPKAWIDLIPKARVVQLHVAGHLTRDDGLRIDTHGEPVCDEVYQLLEYTLQRLGPRPVLLERDNNVPSVDELLAEVNVLNDIYVRATTSPARNTASMT